MAPSRVTSIQVAFTALLACTAAFTPPSGPSSTSVSAGVSGSASNAAPLALASNFLHEADVIAEKAKSLVQDGEKLLEGYVAELPNIGRRSPKGGKGGGGKGGGGKPPTTKPADPTSKPAPASSAPPASSAAPASSAPASSQAASSAVSSSVAASSSAASSAASSAPASSGAASSSAVSSVVASSSGVSASGSSAASSASASVSSGSVSGSASASASAPASKTSSSVSPTGTGINRPLCGADGSKCSKKSCPVPKKKTPKTTRDLLSGSLKARWAKAKALLPRFDEKPDLKDYITEGLPEEPTLNWNAIARFPQQFADDPFNTIGAEQSTGFIYKFDDVLGNLAADKIEGVPAKAIKKIKDEAEDKEGFNIVNGPLTGCTGVYIVSDQAVFVGHYWENIAFDTAAHFTTQALNAIKNGRTVDNKVVHDKLADNKDLFKDAQALIMSPSKNAAEKDTFLYDSRLKQLEEALGVIPGLKTKRVAYLPADSGFEKTKTKTIAGKVVKGVEKTNPDKSKQAEGFKFFYKELKHETDETGDGFTLFQFSKTQGVRIIQEHAIVFNEEKKA